MSFRPSSADRPPTGRPALRLPRWPRYLLPVVAGLIAFGVLITIIAGTGEIAANGAVSPIGGIQQKMAGARAAGATVFLTPAGNCPDTAGAVPQGLRLIKVSTLAGAVHDLQALAAGRSVPSC